MSRGVLHRVPRSGGLSRQVLEYLDPPIPTISERIDVGHADFLALDPESLHRLPAARGPLARGELRRGQQHLGRIYCTALFGSDST